jgi:hypothetical protein
MDVCALPSALLLYTIGFGIGAQGMDTAFAWPLAAQAPGTELGRVRQYIYSSGL